MAAQVGVDLGMYKAHSVCADCSDRGGPEQEQRPGPHLPSLARTLPPPPLPPSHYPTHASLALG